MIISQLTMIHKILLTSLMTNQATVLKEILKENILQIGSLPSTRNLLRRLKEFYHKY